MTGQGGVTDDAVHTTAEGPDGDVPRPAWLVGLAESPATPDDVVAELVGLAVPARPATPAGWRQQAEPFTLDEALLRRPGLTGPQAQALAALSPGHLVRLVARGVLAIHDVPPASRAWPGVLLAALQAPGFPADLDAAVLALDPGRRALAARARHLPQRLRVALARDVDPAVVAAVVSAPGATPELVAQAAAHDDPVVLAAVAASPHAPLDAVARLAGHPHWLVRRGVAAGPLLGEAEAAAVLARLREDLADEPDVLRACQTAATLARNPRTPAWVLGDLDRLFADDPWVRREVALHPRSPLSATEAEAVLGPGHVFRPGIGLDDLARCRKLPAWPLPRILTATDEEVRALAASSDPRLRRLVAWRRDLPLDVLLRLAADADAGVLVAALPDPRVPAPLLAAAAAGHGRRVAGVVAEHLATDAATLTDLLARQERPGSRAARVTGAVARHRNTPPSALVDCLRRHPRTAVAVAGNPALPFPVLRELLGAADDRVARSAAANPSLPGPWARALVAGRLP